MKVLITVASKHGATMEIGQVIEASIRSSGLDVELLRIEDVTSLSPYDAVVLGSGVYSGHWMRQAREFVEVHEGELKQLPVWLFSSFTLRASSTSTANPSLQYIDTTWLLRVSPSSRQSFSTRIGVPFGLRRSASPNPIA